MWVWSPSNNPGDDEDVASDAHSVSPSSMPVTVTVLVALRVSEGQDFGQGLAGWLTSAPHWGLVVICLLLSSLSQTGLGWARSGAHCSCPLPPPPGLPATWWLSWAGLRGHEGAEPQSWATSCRISPDLSCSVGVTRVSCKHEIRKCWQSTQHFVSKVSLVSVVLPVTEPLLFINEAGGGREVTLTLNLACSPAVFLLTRTAGV